MSTQKTITIYEFSELSDAAKETARNWLRECKASDEWWDSTYEDAEQVHLKIDSFDLDHAQIGGHFLEDALATAHAITDEHGDACIDRDIEANEYTFNERGEREDV